MCACITFAEIVLDGRLAFNRMTHCHRAEEESGNKDGKSEEEHGLIRREGSYSTECGGCPFHHEAIEERETETGDQCEYDTGLGALLLASGQLAV